VSLRTTEFAQLGGALNKFIQSNYTQEEHKSCAKAIEDVQSLRVRLTHSLQRNPSDQDHAGTLAQCISYYKILHCMSARFPFQTVFHSASSPSPAVASEPSGFLAKVFSSKHVSHVSVLTTWFDALRQRNRLSDMDWAFERMSILFNIAALMSRQATQTKSASMIGSASNDVSNEHLKESLRLFQLSSGLFDAMASMPEISSCTLANNMSVDLCPCTLRMLSSLVLAQAQAAFFEKSTSTASPKLVAKLAMGVSTLFGDAYALCQKGARIQSIANKPDTYPWQNHCAYQLLCYKGAANFFHAKGMLADDEYGVEIAHLERARNLLAEARKYEIGHLKNLADNRVKLENAVNARLQAAMKDNDTVYYTTIPKQDQIRDPDSVVAAKRLNPLDPSIPGAITIDPSDDPFKHLVSPALRAAAEEAAARLANMQQQLKTTIETQENESKDLLNQLNLPAALDAQGTGASGGLPEEVWTRVHTVQLQGGVAHLKELDSRIDSAVADCQRAFTATTAALQKECESDAELRSKFGHKWNRRPSSQLTVNLQRDADSIRRFLRDAEESNRKVREEMLKAESMFERLALSQEELDRRLPRTSAEQSQASQHMETELRQLLQKLRANTDSMHAVAREMEEKISTTDLMAQVLAANANAQQQVVPSDATGSNSSTASNAAESLFSTVLKPFDSFATQLSTLTSTQSSLLTDIAEANKRFLNTRSEDDSMVRRQAFLQEINVAVATYNKLMANFNEGLKFFADLHAQKIAPLSQKVSDFAMAREMESKLILEQLTRSIAEYKEEEDEKHGGSATTTMASSSSSSSSGMDASGRGNPFASASASNPNLTFDKPSLYHMQSPSPPPQPYQPQAQPQQAAQPPRSQSTSSAQYQPPPAQSPYARQAQSPQVPPRPQQPQQQQEQWACRTCTFLNPIHAPVCAMCATRRQ